ncbi:MAG: hypothetical protein QG577_1921 [Thermodesulfobacteriota bacterium]|nr:hypothetical protein [Thermodesulfobacteriota bacterium]
MKSSLVKFLCKDCFSTFLCLILVLLVVAFVTITCIAATHRTNGAVVDSAVSHQALQTTKELLKKRDIEIEEWLRSREPSSLPDMM